MDLAAMRTAIRTRIGVPSTDTFYTDTVLTDFVNEALQAVSAEEDWPWLSATTTFATVRGTQNYTPPGDWARTKLLCIDGYDPIEWRSLGEIREWASSITDVPLYFTVEADEILLAPVPGGSYTVKHDYYVDEAALALDADTPLMPSEFHYAVVAFAVHLAHARNAEIGSYRGAITGSAAAALQQYAQWLARMRKQRRRQTNPLRIRVRPGGAF